MAFLDATRQFAPNMASQIESTYRTAIHYSLGTDMFDYLTGMSILVPGSNVSEFITNFDEQYDCGEKYPNYSQFTYGYATLLAGGNYTFTLQAPTQASAAVTGGLSDTMLSTVFIPGGTYVAPEDASNSAAAPAPSQPPAEDSGWSGFGSVLSGSITPDDNENEEEYAFLSDMNADYACYMTLSQDELANLSLVEGLLYLDASDDEDTIWIELGAMQNAGIDWQTGDIISGFDGTWPMLDDQLVVLLRSSADAEHAPKRHSRDAQRQGRLPDDRIHRRSSGRHHFRLLRRLRRQWSAGARHDAACRRR